MGLEWFPGRKALLSFTLSSEYEWNGSRGPHTHLQNNVTTSEDNDVNDHVFSVVVTTLIIHLQSLYHKMRSQG